jgi:hypothetical protein
MLDPKRKDSVRPGDGVDDTSHSLLCMAHVLASAEFHDGAKLAKEIAADMVARCSSGSLVTYDDGENAKRSWEAQLRVLRAKLIK